MSCVAHHDDVRLATAFRDRCGTAQRPERWIIAATERSRAFAEQCREVDPADTRHGFEDHDVLPSKAVSRCGFGLADGSAKLIELALGLPQFAINNAQTSDERTHVDAGRFSNAVRNPDGGFSQGAENGLGVNAADAMLLEQLLDRRLTYVARFGRRGCDGPELEKPGCGEVIGQLRHLRVIPPKLMIDAVTQPNPFLLQFLGKPRPCTQCDQLWISNMQPAKQTPVGAYTVSQDIGVPAIVLGTRDTEPVT